MKLAAALAADLYLLTAALGEPEADVADGLQSLVTDAAALIPSYLGLNVVVRGTNSPFSFAVFEDGVAIGDARSSVGIAIPGGEGSTVTFVFYAARPGTFVDLAADLAWLTDRPSTDVALDVDLEVPADVACARPLVSESTVNQAIGVLIGRNLTLAQARRELDSQASSRETDRLAIAREILDTL